MSDLQGPLAAETNRHSWNLQAKRYFEENPLPLNVLDYCGELFPTENDLRLIGNCAGLRVLEIGSGSCNCGIVLAKLGAIVTCTDISEEQLGIGRGVAAAEGVTILTQRLDMADLHELQPDAFDLVISICAMQYASDPRKVFTEVKRVLRAKGRFIFSGDHPVMAAAGAAELWPQEKADPAYSYEGPVVWKWRPEDEMSFVSFRFTVSRLINDLVGAGFAIQSLHELFPKKKDPNWTAKEALLRSRFPSVLVVSAVKSS